MIVGVSFHLFFTPYIVFADVPLFNPLNPDQTVIIEDVIDQETIETTETTEVIEEKIEEIEEEPTEIKKEPKNTNKPRTKKTQPLYLNDDLFSEVEEDLILPPEPLSGGGAPPVTISSSLVRTVSLLAGTVLYGEREERIELDSLF